MPGSDEQHAQRAWSFWHTLGDPRWICAPMVHQSELPFRTLVRRHGVDLAYSPMIRAVELVADCETLGEEAGRRRHFTSDRTEQHLVVQLASNDAQELVAAVLLVQDYCSGFESRVSTALSDARPDGGLFVGSS